MPDLLAGWTLIGLGLALLVLRRPAGAAALLLVAGFAWFAPNFDAAGPDVVEWAATRAAYLHRAPLLQLALALPAGRPSTRPAAAGVALAWTAAVVWPLWEWDLTALLLAGAFVATRGAGARGRVRSPRRALAGRGLAAVALLCGAIGVDAVRSLAGASGAAVDATVAGYALAVGVVGIVLFSAAMLDAPAALAERAVALERSGATLRDALRELLGDPRLEVGFAAGDGELVDDRGRPIAPLDADRQSTPVAVAGRRVAVVFHDPSTLADEATRSAVLAAVGLVAERARLRAEVDRQVDAVAASRRRLLLAEEDERRRLAERLDRGPGTALGDVERLVRTARSGGEGDDRLAAALDQSLVRLDGMRADLDLLVAGLGGIGATGLVPGARAAGGGRAGGRPPPPRRRLAARRARIGALVRLRGMPCQRGEARGCRFGRRRPLVVERRPCG